MEQNSEDPQASPQTPRECHSDCPSPKQMQSLEPELHLGVQLPDEDRQALARSSRDVEPTTDIPPAFSNFMLQCWKQWNKSSSQQPEPSLGPSPAKTKKPSNTRPGMSPLGCRGVLLV